MRSIPTMPAGRPPETDVRPWKVRGRYLCFDMPYGGEYYIRLNDLDRTWIDHIAEKRWATAGVMRGLRAAVAWRMGVPADALPPRFVYGR